MHCHSLCVYLCFVCVYVCVCVCVYVWECVYNSFITDILAAVQTCRGTTSRQTGIDTT